MTKTDNYSKHPLTDKLLEEVIGLILHYGNVSASMLQENLKLGYARSSKLIDELEEIGLIGPNDGMAHPRKVFLNTSLSAKVNMAVYVKYRREKGVNLLMDKIENTAIKSSTWLPNFLTEKYGINLKLVSLTA